MKVDIDDKSGFCFGVVRAITAAEESIAGGESVYCLGDIVHNRVEVQRLGELGLKTIKHDRLEKLRDARVLIRAHGEPPSTYRTAEDNGLELIDATCPVVARLQGIVRQAYAEMQAVGGEVVILGKKGHAEVAGLAGQAGGDVRVIEGLEDVEALGTGKPVYLLSQTTQSLKLFGEVSRRIKEMAADPDKVVVNDTICRRVANREPHLREFASRYDVVIFVSGRKSSNGKVLFDVCKSTNPRSFLVEEETELQSGWFEGARTVGVCGATSTPKWLMQRIAEYIENNY